MNNSCQFLPTFKSTIVLSRINPIIQIQMKTLQSKQLKPSHNPKSAFKPLLVPLLKENAGLFISPSFNPSNTKNELLPRQSPQSQFQKSGFDKNKDTINSNREQSLINTALSSSSLKPNWSALNIPPNLANKTNPNLRNFLKSTSNRLNTFQFSNKDSQIMFSSPPAQFKTKTVILNAPNSTGKVVINSPQSFETKKIGNFLKLPFSTKFPGSPKNTDWAQVIQEGQFNSCCLNHPEKPVKYIATKRLITQSRENKYRAYCSTCAINLMQEGVKVIQIDNFESNSKSIKRSTSPPKIIQNELTNAHIEDCDWQINQFLNSLNSSLESCKALKLNIRQRISTMHLNQQALSKSLDDHFDKITDHLKAKKESLKKQVGLTHQKSNISLNAKLEEMTQISKSLEAIQVDVELHHEKILEKVNSNTLSLILSVYKEQIQDYETRITQTEQLNFTQHTLSFPTDFEKAKKTIDPKVQIIISNYNLKDKKSNNNKQSFVESKIFNSALQPMTDNFLNDEPVFKTSRLLESGGHSDLVISFDKNNSQMMLDFSNRKQHLLKTEDANESSDQQSVNGYNLILDKINQSQNLKHEFYEKYLEEIDKNEDDIFFVNENRIFEFNVDEDMNNKQTPELGQKTHYPKSLNEHYEKLAAARNPYNNSELSGKNSRLMFEDPSFI